MLSSFNIIEEAIKEAINPLTETDLYNIVDLIRAEEKSKTFYVAYKHEEVASC